MIIGIGCDAIEIARVQKAVQKDAFMKKVYTEQEITYCQSKDKQQYASFAARFAAKEAALKALGTGFRGGSLTDIEVINDELGKPVLILHGFYKELADRKGITNYQLSLSHNKETAVAYCVMEV